MEKKSLDSQNNAQNMSQNNEDTLKAFEKKLGKSVVLQAKRIVEDAISQLTSRRAYFFENQLIRRALNISQKEVSEKILLKKEFTDLITWLVSIRPLVTIGHTKALTTYEMWQMENSILDLAGETSDIYIQPEEAVMNAIKRKPGISEEQIKAVYAATTSPKRVTIIEGLAGSGKSYSMETIKETYEDMGYKVIGTALGWAAAKVLSESASLEDENCRAIKGLTMSWLNARANGVDPFQGPTLVIVDEAGMVGTRHMAIILEETKRSRYPVKVILTGDSLQVVPVDAGNPMEAIIEFHGTTKIKTIRRQNQPSHRSAVRRFSEKSSGQAINTFLQQESINWCKDKDALLNKVVQDFVSYKIAFPHKDALVLAVSNKDVLELNYRIRLIYKKLGLIDSEDITLNVNDGRETFEASFSIGDEVLLRANNPNMIVYETDTTKSPLDEKTWKPIRLGVFNRYSGKIVAIRRAQKPIGSYDFIIDIAGDKPGRIIINSETYRHADPDNFGLPMVHNYAGTIYGSQGRTVPKTFLVDNQMMDFRLAYVGMSRHKESVDVYLDESDLHRRLDQSVGKKQSLQSRLKMDSQGKSLSDAKVDIGRYTRNEMLTCVGLSWGRHSDNLTCVIYEQQRREGVNKFFKNNEKNAKVTYASLDENVIDYIPEENQPYPIVDVQKILDLPDPVSDSELIRPSDVEENKKRYGAIDMPVDADNTPLPQSGRSLPQIRDHSALLPTKSPQKENFFTKAISIFNKPESTEASEIPNTRLPDAISPFEDVEGVEPEKPLSKEVLDKLNKWINPVPKYEIPFIPTKQCGSVIFPEADFDFEKECREKNIPDPRPHSISFDGVPQVKGATGGPSDSWIASKRGDLWEVGRFNEPRIIAKNAKGLVVARYKLNGKCVVGEGFPPVCVNKNGNERTPIYIVSGAKEYLWLREVMENKHANNPQNIPHIVWAANDIDWSFIAPSFKKSEKVVIVRSKTDDRQIPWALDLQKILKERFGVSTIISPKVEAEPAIDTQAKEKIKLK